MQLNTQRIKSVLEISESETIKQLGGYIVCEYNGNSTIHWYNNSGVLIPLVKGTDTALSVFAKLKNANQKSAVYVYDAENHDLLGQQETMEYIKSLGLVPYIDSESEEGYAVSVDISKCQLKDFISDIKETIEKDPEDSWYRCLETEELIRYQESIPESIPVYSLYMDNKRIRAITTPLYCFSEDQKSFSHFGLITGKGAIYSLDMKELKMIFNEYNLKAKYDIWHNKVSFEAGGYYANSGIQGLWVRC